MSENAVCPVCPHHCNLQEGSIGRCRARINQSGKVVSSNYGKLTSIALDPIEKKPLAFFHPGSKVLSIGSFGCNMACPFCQNYDIAYAGENHFTELRTYTPERLTEIALDTVSEGNIGIAYTYNEALVGYEFVRDTAKLISEVGLLNVLVTNGNACIDILDEILPYIDAMNIDLKCFTEEGYKSLGGNFETVKAFIEEAHTDSHIEITSLIVPGLNDSLDDMEEEAKWIASIDPDIPLHITRYFPRFKYREAPTDIGLMNELKGIADKHLSRVLLGNV